MIIIQCHVFHEMRPKTSGRIVDISEIQKIMKQWLTMSVINGTVDVALLTWWSRTVLAFQEPLLSILTPQDALDRSKTYGD